MTADMVATNRLVLDARLLTGWPLPTDEHGDKFARGTVLVIGGSSTTPGAVILAGMASLRMGAGRLQIAAAASAAVAVAVAVPEALVLPLADADGDLALERDDGLSELIGQADAVLIGPGLQSQPTPVSAVEHVLTNVSQQAIVVVDAAGLGALPETDPRLRQRVANRLLLTPNRQEVERLLTGSERPAQSAGDLNELLALVAQQYDATVTSFGTVQSSDGRCWHTDVGHPSLGTSGSGDVLAGFAVGAAARTGDAAHAACWATYAHVAAGEQLGRSCGALGFLARELIAEAARLEGLGQ